VTVEPIRLAVNLSWCVPGEVGGSEQYLVRQLVGLAGQPDPPATTLFATPAFRTGHGDELPAASWCVTPSDGRRRWRRIVDEHTWLYRVTGGFDVVVHGGGTVPRRARRPAVVVIHDLQYRTFPQYFSRAKRWYLDAMIPASARGAAAITVPSAYVRDSVVRELGVDAAKVHVVPHGYEPSLLVDRTPADQLRRRFDLADRRVLLYPAMTAPHKRHDVLIDLVRSRRLDDDVCVAFIGGPGVADATVRAAIADPSMEARVRHLGRVSDADRNGLVALAEALVFPSEYEGFGAPLIEAMAIGTPVLCSDATCLPEVVGDAGVVRPLALDAWVDGLAEVRRRRDELVAAGRRRVDAFTAERSGAALADVLRVVTGAAR
jgi:glycosyltransferase involved in cell wall biosynthesis